MLKFKRRGKTNNEDGLGGFGLGLCSGFLDSGSDALEKYSLNVIDISEIA